MTSSRTRMTSLRISLVLACSLIAAGLTACGGNTVSTGGPMPDWGRQAHEDASNRN